MAPGFATLESGRELKDNRDYNGTSPVLQTTGIQKGIERVKKGGSTTMMPGSPLESGKELKVTIDVGSNPMFLHWNPERN